MKVENMTNSNGNKVINQFIIRDDRGTYFQSHRSIIVFVPFGVGCYDKDGTIHNDNKIQLDERKWDYSKTTGRYRNQFLGETKRERHKRRLTVVNIY